MGAGSVGSGAVPLPVVSADSAGYVVFGGLYGPCPCLVNQLINTGHAAGSAGETGSAISTG